MNRSIYFDLCEKRLTLLCYSVELRGKLNILNYNLHCEDFYVHFFNLLFGVVCGRGRNPTLRLWPTIFSGKIDVFPGDRRSRLISSMTSVAPA
ncbi:SMEK domain-containing protein [Escherichia coli]|uniref:SMEK domain-containing protein n=1 Tax=Escherichia coli TaxID=562 RepID=UPI002FBD7193